MERSNQYIIIILSCFSNLALLLIILDKKNHNIFKKYNLFSFFLFFFELRNEQVSPLTTSILIRK